MIKSAIKSILYAVAPVKTTELLSARARAHSHRLIKEWGIDKLNRKLIDLLGTKVQSGPFAGMQLTPMTFSEHLGPFLLGCYEAELHPWLNIVKQIQFSQIIDVGAKFGYYAVGLALNRPEVETIGFDTDEWARKAMMEMAEANCVATLRIEGFCSPNWFKHNLKTNSFIISDCEGYEGELLCSIPIPALKTAHLIIEIHEMFQPGVKSRIYEHYKQSHEIEIVQSSVRNPPNIEVLKRMLPKEIEQAILEIRCEQEWLFLSPKK
ncbi:MAG: hypothetical protein WCT04_25535 [Planctomycetota bacterium]